MKVEDAHTQNRRLWVRLHEEEGKIHEMPCYHNLEEYLITYINETDLRDNPQGFLFRTIGRETGQLTFSLRVQANAQAMIQSYIIKSGIATKAGITASGQLVLPLILKMMGL